MRPRKAAGCAASVPTTPAATSIGTIRCPSSLPSSNTRARFCSRATPWAEGVFALITGFLEQGETPEAGIAREVLEETSLYVRETELVGVYDFIRKNELIIAYHVKAEGEISLSPELL